MKLTRKGIRRIIREVLSERSRAEWREDFGDDLFGWHRRTGESDTEIESRMARAVADWYTGYGYSLDRQMISIMQQMRRDGMYTDVLEPPLARYAYRFIFVRNGTTRLGLRDARVVQEKEFHKVLDFDIPPTGLFVRVKRSGPIALSVRRTRKEGASWTVDPGALRKIWMDWGYNMSGWGKEAHTLVILRTSVKDNRESFLLNPDETVGLAGQYEYQREIVQVGALRNVEAIAYELLQRTPDGGEEYLVNPGGSTGNHVIGFALSSFEYLFDK